MAPPSETELAGADEALARELEALFRTQPADFWEARLVASDIACVRADAWVPNNFWLEHPQAAALRASVPSEHPAWGSYRRHGAMVTFDEVEPAAAPPPLAGQHNGELLGELGYDTAQIAALEQAGVIWSE